MPGGSVGGGGESGTGGDGDGGGERKGGGAGGEGGNVAAQVTRTPPPPGLSRPHEPGMPPMHARHSPFAQLVPRHPPVSPTWYVCPLGHVHVPPKPRTPGTRDSTRSPLGGPGLGGGAGGEGGGGGGDVAAQVTRTPPPPGLSRPHEPGMPPMHARHSPFAQLVPRHPPVSPTWYVCPLGHVHVPPKPRTPGTRDSTRSPL